ASPLSGRLEELGLSSCLGPAGVRALAGSASFGELRFLSLDGCEAGDRECETLANSSTLPRLTFLSLGGYLHRPSSITADGVQALIGSPNLSRLKHLHLDNSGLGDAGAEVLAKADWRELRFLSLGWNGIGEPGVRALIRSRLWPNLQYLVLSGNPFGDAGA